jgi:hypothetical protein
MPFGAPSTSSFADGVAHGSKDPKTVNHPHQVGLGELLSMASTRLRGEVGGPIGLTKPTNKKLLVALLLRPAIML